ncbi:MULTISPECIES: TrkH family potassium uptake protein [unclassified Psychrobacter]|uniref:TrkH family potassium uptake protein n=1 Tax=unclassified Psychrobacter TaxID=196806 RepID=UPI0009A65575|nr:MULTISPECIES: potassium transporter TrkG [unclassified Psychrobacter]OXL28850.1 ATPase [Psychrobacter sp. DAB_AL32B]SLJ85287.1 K+ uptake transporter, KtrB subunit [Psychrobacter sp. DAB_AL43B]
MHPALPYRLLNKLTIFISLIGVGVALIDSGFTLSTWLQHIFHLFYLTIILLGFVATVWRYVRAKTRLSVNKVAVFDLVTSVAILILLAVHFTELARSGLSMPVDGFIAIKIAVFVTFIREISDNNFSLNRAFLNPGQFFILSFLSVVLVGALLLMMPNATTEPISFVDALFTATSAVCVTGLIVVDTATRFTTFGQVIIIGLIQIGGLGILTFVTYFSYFFKGGVSYETQLSISEMTFSRRLGDMVTTLKSILYVTFGVEALAAILIYISIYDLPGMNFSERLFFSAFHAISAFCNAGFSTFSAGLYDDSLRFNYPLQLIISTTFLFGGMGFIIVVNLLRYLRHRAQRALHPHDPRYGYQPWLLSINSRITLITSGVLLLIGLIGVLMFEYNGILAEHSSFYGKVITGLFTAATPRTAGFNIADMDALAFPTIMLTIFLMWIGASPNSTGGGIKTSTFAIAVLNTLSLARGQTKVEVFQREIADISIRRAFSIMWLSLLVIGLGVTLISYDQPELDLIKVIFECFSAYSTVGLSLNLTADLSTFSKLVVSVIMFVGRVGMLTIFVALLKNRHQRNYRYPTEEITIN